MAGSSGSVASAGGENPNTKQQTANKPQIPSRNAGRSAGHIRMPLQLLMDRLSQILRQLGDLEFFRLDQRHELLHLGREPANRRILVIAAARLFGPIAAQEGPDLR